MERTLLANGILLAGLESRRLGGAWVETPELGYLLLSRVRRGATLRR